MSYSAHLPGFDITEDDEAQLHPSDMAVSPPFDALHAEPRTQFQNAVSAVNKILASGVLGGEGTKVNINISGHANPDFESHPVNNPAPNNLSIQIVSVREELQDEGTAATTLHSVPTPDDIIPGPTDVDPTP